MNRQRGLPRADSPQWEAELDRLYKQREMVSCLIDSLEQYRVLVADIPERRVGDSGMKKKPCMPSYRDLTCSLIPGGRAIDPATAALRTRRAG